MTTDLDPEGLEKALIAVRDLEGLGDYTPLPGEDCTMIMTAIRAYEAHRSAGGASVPAGWKLVPEEATRAMWQAALQHEADREHGKIPDRYLYFSKIWTAMLRVSPPPPAAPQAETGWISVPRDDLQAAYDLLNAGRGSLERVRVGRSDLFITREGVAGLLYERLQVAAPQAETAKRTPCNDRTEPSCRASWHWDDGVPYCDECGYFRNSVTRRAQAETAGKGEA
jgi:hypothetical protein